MLLRRMEPGLVASRGLLGSSVLGSLFTLEMETFIMHLDEKVAARDEISRK